jgi:hypothetical protein
MLKEISWVYLALGLNGGVCYAEVYCDSQLSTYKSRNVKRKGKQIGDCTALEMRRAARP